MDVTESRYASALRVLLVFAISTAFVRGPPIEVGMADVAAFDLIFLLLVGVFLLYLLENPRLEVPITKLLLFVSLIYFGLAIFLPFAGIVLYSFPATYIVGDIRWLQLLFLGVVMISLYARSGEAVNWDLETAFKIILVTHFVVFSLQLSNYLGVFDTSGVLELWYRNRSQYGDYGYHIGRFAGAAAHSSKLGLSSVLAITIFGRASLAHRRGVPFLVLACFLLIASGNRTSMVAAAGVFGLLFGYALVTRGLSEAIIRRSGLAGVFVLPLFWVAYFLNLGRVASSDRYSELVDVLLGRADLAEISGRADRWEAALARSSDYPYGTLSNAVHVYQDLQVVDSYFVIAYLQGGVLFVVSFLLLLFTISLSSIRSLGPDNRALIPLSMVGISAAFSLTSNYITGTSGKAVLVLAIVLVILTKFSE